MLIIDAALNVSKVLKHMIMTEKEFTDAKEVVAECQLTEDQFVQSLNKVEDFIGDIYAIVDKIKKL